VISGRSRTRLTTLRACLFRCGRVEWGGEADQRGNTNASRRCPRLWKESCETDSALQAALVPSPDSDRTNGLATTVTHSQRCRTRSRAKSRSADRDRIISRESARGRPGLASREIVFPHLFPFLRLPEIETTPVYGIEAIHTSPNRGGRVRFQIHPREPILGAASSFLGDSNFRRPPIDCSTTRRPSGIRLSLDFSSGHVDAPTDSRRPSSERNRCITPDHDCTGRFATAEARIKNAAAVRCTRIATSLPTPSGRTNNDSIHFATMIPARFHVVVGAVGVRLNFRRVENRGSAHRESRSHSRVAVGSITQPSE